MTNFTPMHGMNKVKKKLGDMFLTLINTVGRLIFQILAVTLCTTRLNIKKFYVVPTLRLCVLYGSQNKQQLLPYKTSRDWFLSPKWRVFTARYALSPYIKQIRFVFIGLST
jgi:hypothetical protein